MTVVAPSSFYTTWLIIAILIMALTLIQLCLMVWALIDISGAKNDGMWKVMWILVCLLGGLMGIIVYLIVGRKDKKK